MAIESFIPVAVSLVVQCLTKAGDGALKKAGEDVWNKIKNKFTQDKDDFAQKNLQRLEEDPFNEGRQRALQDVLSEKAKEDKQFASDLEKLIQEQTKNETVGSFITNNFGTIGNLTNFHSADTVNIGTPNIDKSKSS